MITTRIDGKILNGYEVNLRETVDGWCVTAENVKTGKLDAWADLYYVDYETAKEVYITFAKKFYKLGDK